MTLPPTLGVVLAGGSATRMGGGDKTLLELAGRTLLEHLVERLRPQCTDLILNANGDAGRFQPFGLTVVPDTVPGQPGPLAGLLSAFEWAAARRPDLEWVVSVPGDTPFVPRDLVSRLHEAQHRTGGPVACAASGETRHPVIGLWPVRLRDDLRRALTVADLRQVGAWAAACGAVYVDWTPEPVDPFFNVNRREDLAAASAWMSATMKDDRAGAGAGIIELDLTGLKCPLPTLRTRKALRGLPAGGCIRVTCTDPLAAIDIPHLVHQMGDSLIEQSHDGSRLRFVIRRKARP